ncbi:ADP-ribosylglycohydrolase family protein [Tautonia plasticadhaerens]|uniref:ADP-ribosyl-[dinitrogen reductase] glycohydrolase n=1 Tax=Tautonia plasticadhaerens TaxID=2527974 RepID=A0A518HE79_9BACT|nr:ADP-ribosylglycohydrolase family protein [Tautonia plasticadhaerens]QDV39159.1 ADP-ribosyl-[dinitrogen reductase] glycohydrolase [Tautonia plasticadhaerens]
MVSEDRRRGVPLGLAIGDARGAPVAYACRLPDRFDEVVRRRVESSLPTHRSPACRSACASLGVLPCGLLHGLPREGVLAPAWEAPRRLDERVPLDAELREVALGGSRRERPPEIQGGVPLARSPGATPGAFAGAEDFRTSVLRAANPGDDADTTGAVRGQLAGACRGESGIPAEWRPGLGGRALIEAVSRRLIDEPGATVRRRDWLGTDRRLVGSLSASKN